MKPTRAGQIVRFRTLYKDEDPNQLYVVLEAKEDGERSRADIQALNTGLPYPPVNKVRLDDLEIVEVSTDDLIGNTVIIDKSDYSQVEGIVVKVSEKKIMLDLTKGVQGVKTNVWITVLDKNRVEHTGTLFVK